MNAWLPIETAPKDGTPVLIFAAGHMAVAFADPENDFAWTLDDGHDYHLCLRRGMDCPTHWTPLPESP